METPGLLYGSVYNSGFQLQNWHFKSHWLQLTGSTVLINTMYTCIQGKLLRTINEAETMGVVLYGELKCEEAIHHRTASWFCDKTMGLANMRG